MAVAQAAASGRPTFEMTIGPVATFGVDSPVRFLSVDPWAPVVDLYEACWTGVFDRPRHRDFHPHVTVDINGGPTAGDDPAVELLAHYEATVLIDRLTVVEHVDDPDHRHWAELLSYRLG